LNKQKTRSLLLAFLGLVLIVLGIKYIPAFQVDANGPSSARDIPVILFFSLDDPCECMVELIQNAEQQIAAWPLERQGGIPVIRVPMELHKDLEAKYRVFRAPCLVLVDAQDQVAWRQDYPLIEGGPFKLEELESAIGKLGFKD
jgi:hypothetical protein